jgi:hypothetical protein
MSPDQETEDHEATESGEEKSSEDMSASEKAQQEAEEREKASERVQELEDDPPTDLSQWPDDKGKYITFGGPEGDHGYEEGPEQNLGPTEVRHHEDGRVTVSGEEVDPDDYKGDPIPGGPTDPNSPDLAGESDDDDDDDDGGGSSSPGSQNGQTADDEDEDE